MTAARRFVTPVLSLVGFLIAVTATALLATEPTTTDEVCPAGSAEVGRYAFDLADVTPKWFRGVSGTVSIVEGNPFEPFDTAVLVVTNTPPSYHPEVTGTLEGTALGQVENHAGRKTWTAPASQPDDRDVRFTIDKGDGPSSLRGFVAVCTTPEPTETPSTPTPTPSTASPTPTPTPHPSITPTPTEPSPTPTPSGTATPSPEPTPPPTPTSEPTPPAPTPSPSVSPSPSGPPSPSVPPSPQPSPPTGSPSTPSSPPPPTTTPSTTPSPTVPSTPSNVPPTDVDTPSSSTSPGPCTTSSPPATNCSPTSAPPSPASPSTPSTLGALPRTGSSGLAWAAAIAVALLAAGGTAVVWTRGHRKVR